jgi:hypothetical protein
LPQFHYDCEFSYFYKVIDKCSKESFENFIDEGLKNFFVVGSTSNVAASLLFEHVVWNEGGLPLVIFRRLRLKPAIWFCSVFSSLFASILTDPITVIQPYLKEKSIESLIMFGYILFKHLIPDLQDVLINEKFQNVCRILLYPLIDFHYDSDDESEIERLVQLYQPTTTKLFSILVQTKAMSF